MNKEFLHLTKTDKLKLLSRNVPLYIQYILARYINSESGYEQISWLLGNHTPHMRSKEKSKLRRISLKRLNQHINLFHFGADLDSYEELTYRMKVRKFSNKHF